MGRRGCANAELSPNQRRDLPIPASGVNQIVPQRSRSSLSLLMEPRLQVVALH